MSQKHPPLLQTQKRTITKRIFVAISLLLVAIMLTTAATYAWIILSKAPEAKNISTTLGANGNLEIALATADHLNLLKENDMYDTGVNSEFTNGDLLHDNLLWGNMIDLSSSDYGLTTTNIRPAVLNILNSRVADIPISVVKYGTDGRAEKLAIDIANPDIDTLGFTGVYAPSKGGYYAGSLAISFDDLQAGNFNKNEVILSVLNQREYGVRIAGLLDYNARTNAEQTDASIDLMIDGYCFAIDMLLRTNSPDANLLLQTDGIQRVDDEHYEYMLDYSGSGSFMEISDAKLASAMRVVFADTITGEVYALAQPDTQGRLWLTARIDENGKLTVVNPGDDQIIKPLTENQVSAITAWVYLDGTVANNSYASIMAAASMKLNLQFATDINLTPAHPDGNGTLDPWKTLAVGDTYSYGVYEQDNVLDNGYEPLEWQVLAVNKSKALLISKYAIDVLPYHEDGTNVSWSESTIRNWLNSSFINLAFTDAEKEALVTTTMNPDASRDDRVYDKLFLLSESEAMTYFKADSDRIAEATTYTLSHCSAYGEQHTACLWWLRGSINDADYAHIIGADGSAVVESHLTNEGNVCIRPVMWIDLGVAAEIKAEKPDAPTEPEAP